MQTTIAVGRAIKWFQRGFDKIIPIAPPGSKLYPNSKIAQENVGKVPTFPSENSDFWGGMSPQSKKGEHVKWNDHVTSLNDCEFWDSKKSGVGLRSDYFPAIDIDIEHDDLSARVLDNTYKFFDCKPPCRTGKAPKRLLMFRTETPFGKKRLDFMDERCVQHAVEILGMGNQYVIDGIHPRGMAYKFDWEPQSPEVLKELTEDEAVAYLKDLSDLLEILGCEVLTKDVSKTDTVPTERLIANDLELLRKAVDSTPNNNDVAAARDDYFKYCAALYNATPQDRDAGKRMFLSWSDRWEHGTNDQEYASAMFDSCATSTNPRVGAEFIYRLARDKGTFNYGEVIFDDASHLVVEPATPFEPYSHQELTIDMAEHLDKNAVFIPELGVWAFRDRMIWQPDPSGDKHNSLMYRWILGYFKERIRQLDDSKISNDEKSEIRQMLSRQSHMMACFNVLTKAHPELHRALHLFDANPDILNTPDGVFCLKTGQMLELDFTRDDHLCLKQTLCSPDFSMPTPYWDQFLLMITRVLNPQDEGIQPMPDGDPEIIEFLQVFFGYALTGHTSDHKFAFLYGTGGNGKSTLLEVMRALFGLYATKVNSEVFTRAKKDNHPTAMTAFHGARFAYCSEFDEDDSFDSARIKELTGGDSITARRMHKDYYTFLPTHTLAIASNWRPRLDTVDDAIKRRVMLVPFDLKLEDHEKDPSLKSKLAQEYPGILAWCIRGAMKWYQSGLPTTKRIQIATKKYFDESDVIQQFLDERCVVNVNDPNLIVLKKDLFAAWDNYSRNEYRGKFRLGKTTFLSRIESRGFVNVRVGHDRQRGFVGIHLKGEDE
jgi:putative DNA primase/helicase